VLFGEAAFVELKVTSELQFIVAYGKAAMTFSKGALVARA
jgi:hypothetical protein